MAKIVLTMQNNNGWLAWRMDGKPIEPKGAGTKDLNPKATKHVDDCVADVVIGGGMTLYGVRCASTSAELSPASGNVKMEFDRTKAVRWKMGGQAMIAKTTHSGRKWNADLDDQLNAAIPPPFQAEVFVDNGTGNFIRTPLPCKKVAIAFE